MPEKNIRKGQQADAELSPAQNVHSPETALSSDFTLGVICDQFADTGESYAGQTLVFHAQLKENGKEVSSEGCKFEWSVARGNPAAGKARIIPNQQGKTLRLATDSSFQGPVEVSVKTQKGDKNLDGKMQFCLNEPQIADLKANFDQKADQLVSRLESGIGVQLQRSAVASTSDLALWVVIRESTRALNFENYQRFMNLVLCGNGDAADEFGEGEAVFNRLRRRRRALPFNDTDAYRLLKTATEAFLLVSGGVGGDILDKFDFRGVDFNALNARVDGLQFNQQRLRDLWEDYLVEVNGIDDLTVPYLQMVQNKLRDQPLKNQIFRFEDPLFDRNATSTLTPPQCEGVLQAKLSRPFFTELIWSYWHEEGMQVQTMNALCRRFQNMRNLRGERDPLAGIEIDPLRPLNNLLWGYIQDEQHRLSLVRRAYEYDHHYGFSLVGKAVPPMRTADSRSKFLEAFHQLLSVCVTFFKQDDDTTVRADGFPLLNALKEVHLVLSQGAHNQFGDLPSTARQEMLLQQWLLARPEFREILPTRIMVAYPEPWMDRVDAMKSLQGWTDTSVQHFHNLAVYGEQLLLSIRYGAWNQSNAIPAQAANWARFWRAEIQSYIHAYRTATGVDLSILNAGRIDSTPPSVYLRRRMPRRA